MRPLFMVSANPVRDAPPYGSAATELFSPFEVTLGATPDAPAAAGAALTAWMAGRVSDTMLADARLLVVELVTNSVRHANVGGDAVVSVRARVRDDVLWLEVEDPGRGGPIAPHAPDLQHGGGFGLHLVELLCRRWGVQRDTGTRVWAELAFEAAPETR
jgi:anti-sigma regulatory factor (Ser/Thr protein kinase)